MCLYEIKQQTQAVWVGCFISMMRKMLQGHKKKSQNSLPTKDPSLQKADTKTFIPRKIAKETFVGGKKSFYVTKAEAPILWSPDVNSQLIGKDPDAGEDWGQEKGVTNDEMVGWHHRFNGHELGQAPGDGDGQGSLACCRPRGHKESDTTERLNNMGPQTKWWIKC